MQLLFIPADPPAITLWRFNAAWNAADAEASAFAFGPQASLRLSDGTSLRGMETIQAALREQLQLNRGWIGAESRSSASAPCSPVLAIP